MAALAEYVAYLKELPSQVCAPMVAHSQPSFVLLRRWMCSGSQMAARMLALTLGRVQAVFVGSHLDQYFNMTNTKLEFTQGIIPLGGPLEGYKNTGDDRRKQQDRELRR